MRSIGLLRRNWGGYRDFYALCMRIIRCACHLKLLKVDFYILKDTDCQTDDF